MSAIDPYIAFLMVSPDETLIEDVDQCRITDDLLTKSYDIVAQIGRIRISFPPCCNPVAVSRLLVLMPPHRV